VAEEEARAGDVAVGSGLKREEDVEGKVGLLPSGSECNGEWWPAVLNGEQRQQRCRVEHGESEAWSGAARKQKCERQSSARPRACFIGGKNPVGGGKPRRRSWSEVGDLGAVRTAPTSGPRPV
jgi:hypothetical protein